MLLPGLSGNSWRNLQRRDEIHRLTPAQPLPFVNRQREFRILHKLRHTELAGQPIGYDSGRLTVEWVEGKPLATQAFIPQNSELLALLMRLHQQPLLGYRIPFLALLQRYWQLCQQRHPRWLRQLKRLQRQGEPRPLRLVPLHMDLHPGNIIQTEQGLMLIDWEYSADGDIALELAALCLQDASQSEGWISAYAQALKLDSELLSLQVKRWQPWLTLLQASWYQLRAEQTQLSTMKQQAAESWRHLLLY
ncbi:thiamine kinase [Rosenbergiella sp. S61]|uniref:Thiamine kinase n=2 Tax=Rosenbergiella gaditana TaxID=2726987 RepID=A0ABS5SV55_9GAMM|nr:thiamine kinase [Rosenbergiella gaditana]MBT0723318.1 thiamine kinase [Rosenbergiella gaditana]